MLPALIAAGSQLTGGMMESYDNSENRKLSRRGLEQQERNARFQRLLSLINQTQGMQQNAGAGQRLLALRNTGTY